MPNTLPLVNFLISFAGIAALVFVSFMAAYMGLSATCFSQPHGNEGAWDLLRKQLQLLLNSEVLMCKPLHVVVLNSPTHTDLEYVVFMARAFPEIEATKRRLRILHRRSRFIAIGIVLSFVGGLLLSSPVMFGQPPISQRVDFFAALVPMGFATAFYWFYIYRQAKTWSELQTYVVATSSKLEGVTLEPLPW